MPQHTSSICHWNDRLLVRLAESYRRFRRKPSPGPLPAVHQTLDLATRYANKHLTEEEKLLGARCYRACRESREAVLRQSAPEACRSLATASWLARQPALSAEAALLLWAEVYPAEAFCEMHWGNLPRARVWIDRSMAADFQLEDEHGHLMKIAHRLHMATVSAAWCMQQEEWEQGCRRCARILRLLSGNAEALDEPGAWDQQRIDHLPQGMRDFIAIKVMDILFCTLAAHSGHSRVQMARMVLDSLAPDSLDGLESAGSGYSAAELLGLLHAAVAESTGYALRTTVALEGVGCRQLRAVLAFDATCLLLESGSSLNGSPLLAELLSDLAETPATVPLKGRLHQRLVRLLAEDNGAARHPAPTRIISNGM